MFDIIYLNKKQFLTNTNEWNKLSSKSNYHLRSTEKCKESSFL